jgi:hypothetical protein
MNKLKVYQAEAPHYAVVSDLIGDALAEGHETLATLNTVVLRAVCSYLGIPTPIVAASSLPLDLPEQCAAGEWALHISKRLGATEYRNAAGGRGLFSDEFFANHGITLSFHEHHPRKYTTGSFDFVDNLSVIDWMMWNDRDTLHAWLG